uniref:Probable chemoreceptor glutamine deamidase CheD n=1 Tax=Magnetococcus massalia (strain MO-1) TaxID=451514 RepID=A0A1S7LFK0_MAGMO|nr:putative chemoreceptor glutamine deamidase CheD [cheD] [Candidatus Magnetococcus massalia]
MNAPPETGKHFLLPGAIFVKAGHFQISTVLGSCIAVCLWDPRTKQGGMNHFKLPLWNGDGLASPKFGNIAIEKLIEGMVEIGCDKKALQAKVFGGAAVLKNGGGLLNVGQRNVQVAQDMLKQHRIPILASDLGGEVSRKIIMDTQQGSILMKRAKA